MEKTNELNKFLSYIHMGNCVYRIYYDAAKELEDKNLVKLIKDIQKKFRDHENTITDMIHSYDEIATRSLTSAGIIGVYREKLKSFDDSFSICINAIKSTNMGMLSTLKFLKQNEKIDEDFKEVINKIIEDYINIQEQFIVFILENCISKKCAKA